MRVEAARYARLGIEDEVDASDLERNAGRLLERDEATPRVTADRQRDATTAFG